MALLIQKDAGIERLGDRPSPEKVTHPNHHLTNGGVAESGRSAAYFLCYSLEQLCEVGTLMAPF